jgi:hypothetical protein
VPCCACLPILQSIHLSLLSPAPQIVHHTIHSLPQARALHPHRPTLHQSDIRGDMSADGKPSHARNASNESHRPSLNTQQPDQNSHIVVKGLPKSVLKKRSADEHTALLNSQREAAAAASGAAQDGGDYFGDIDDEDDWGESKSTWYMILLTLAIGG